MQMLCDGRCRAKTAMGMPFVRIVIVAAIAAAMTLAAHGGIAAPTCQDKSGDTIRCATEGAMPVGWTLPPEERLERQKLKPPVYPSTNQLLELVCVLGVFFSLMALMPEFESGRGSDWDKQEEDG